MTAAMNCTGSPCRLDLVSLDNCDVNFIEVDGGPPLPRLHLDCMDWTVQNETEEEAHEYLTDMYGDDDD